MTADSLQFPEILSFKKSCNTCCPKTFCFYCVCLSISFSSIWGTITSLGCHCPDFHLHCPQERRNTIIPNVEDAEVHHAFIFWNNTRLQISQGWTVGCSDSRQLVESKRLSLSLFFGYMLALITFPQLCFLPNQNAFFIWGKESIS